MTTVGPMAIDHLSPPTGQMADNVVGFARALRAAGIPVGPGAVIDALKRRCLYHWVDSPSAERELAIVKSRVPGISAKLSQQVVGFVQALRAQDFYKSPGVAETIDWATALTELDARSLTPQVVGDTLGALLKYQDDIARMQGDTLQKILKEATSEN